MSEQIVHLPDESKGSAPGRGRLKGRAILVVGGGQMDIGEDDTPIGNGRAIAVLCAREGAKVAVADRDEKSADATVAMIAREKGAAHAIMADVTKETEVTRMVEEALARLGHLDGIVLNVGIGAGGPWLEGTTAEVWDRVFAVNIRSHMLTVRAALPKLRDGSSIVFVSSVAGMKPGSRLPAYDASKAGLFGLCRHAALDPRQCDRAGIDGHVHRAACDARTPWSCHDKRAAGPAGHRLGNGLYDAVSAVGRKRLYHGTNLRRRRRLERTQMSMMQFPPKTEPKRREDAKNSRHEDAFVTKCLRAVARRHCFSALADGQISFAPALHLRAFAVRP
jgi:NAD(P)-dependent dehydrogenase (short-subunit alcohol dehydrogenase family)